MVYGGGLENRWGVTASGGSNPSLSAFYADVAQWLVHQLAKLEMAVRFCSSAQKKNSKKLKFLEFFCYIYIVREK